MGLHICGVVELCICGVVVFYICGVVIVLSCILVELWSGIRVVLYIINHTTITHIYTYTTPQINKFAFP